MQSELESALAQRAGTSRGRHWRRPHRCRRACARPGRALRYRCAAHRARAGTRHQHQPSRRPSPLRWARRSAGSLPCALFGAAHAPIATASSTAWRAGAGGGQRRLRPQATACGTAWPRLASCCSARMTSARSAPPNARQSRRCATCCSCACSGAGDFVLLEVTANAFLHHMVRNIAGLLIHIGAGEAAPGHAAGGARRAATAAWRPPRRLRRACTSGGCTTRRYSDCRTIPISCPCPSGCPADLMDA